MHFPCTLAAYLQVSKIDNKVVFFPRCDIWRPTYKLIWISQTILMQVLLSPCLKNSLIFLRFVVFLTSHRNIMSRQDILNNNKKIQQCGNNKQLTMHKSYPLNARYFSARTSKNRQIKFQQHCAMPNILVLLLNTLIITCFALIISYHRFKSISWKATWDPFLNSFHNSKQFSRYSTEKLSCLEHNFDNTPKIYSL